ncbi:MAG: (2Fe-2S) ferredoxin domain-containing protein [Candidatus Eremiobacteraeota bacterium]|nr:(2Fe-2S) ferredoxin domain-containing protein [Candidatus Eremiobacteraeota bacterium]
MPKIRIEDLDKISEKVRKETYLREGGEIKAKIIVHMGTCGIAAGARKIVNAVMEEIKKSDRKDIILTTSGCAGLCSKEPMMTVEIEGEPPVKYIELTEEKVSRIFKEHILGGNIVKDYALAMGSERLA